MAIETDEPAVDQNPQGVDPPQIRENMITTAVKFLQNPQVRGSPFAQRKTFLEKKGLTKEEIDIAIERSGTAADEHAVATPVSQTQMIANQPPIVPIAPPISTWQKIRDVISSAIVVGGLSYGVYIFFKRYIAPHWFGPSKQDKQLDALESSMIELQKSVKDMLQNIQETNSTLCKHLQDRSATAYGEGNNDIIREIKDEIVTVKNQVSTSDIKQEIKSLKGLLLSRNQFPQTPATKPVIPTWQLTNTSKEADTEKNAQIDIASDTVPDMIIENAELVNANKDTFIVNEDEGVEVSNAEATIESTIPSDVVNTQVTASSSSIESEQ